jgi:hypothetical protein
MRMSMTRACVAAMLCLAGAGCSRNGKDEVAAIRVVSGNAVIARDAHGVIITQRSARAVIAWPRLAIKSGDALRLLQPSRDAVLELRSDGGAWIAGRIVADGNFTIASARGDIVNDGVIVTAPGGRVRLRGARVVNRGSITAERGEILLHGDLRDGRVEVGGTLDASAARDGDGGFIDTTAAHVAVAENFRVTTAGARGKTGTWRIDPNDYTIAASGGDITGAQLAASLASSNVVIESSAGANSGSGNVYVNDAVSYGSNQLTLTAANDIQVKAVITVGGSGTIAFNPNTANGADAASTAGRLLMRMTPAGFLGRVDFPGRAGAGLLQIGGNAYTIINSLGAAGSTSGADLQGISGATGGFFALGGDLEASGTSTWNGGAGFQPIATFTGQFDGLGHVVEHLVVNAPSNDNVGLFGATGGAEIRNLGVFGGSVIGESSVGGLIGSMTNGRIVNSFAATPVSGISNVGGLVGSNSAGQIIGTFASGDVSSIGTSSVFNIGGLVGNDVNGYLASSFAAGRVNAVTGAGGFAGGTENDSIVNCYSTGPVYVLGDGAGAFIGYSGGNVEAAYAAGYTRAGNIYASAVGGYSSNDDGSGYPSYYCQGDSTGLSGITTPGLKACTDNLRGALPANFDPTVWGTGPGLFPFLQWFYPDGAQPMTGGVWRPMMFAAPGARVELWVGGVQAAVASAGATGSYALAMPNDVLTTGSPMLVYAATDSISDFGAFGGLAGGKVTRVGTDIGGNLYLGFVTDGVTTASTSTMPPVDLALRSAAIGEHTELLGYPRGVSSPAASFTVDTTFDPAAGFAAEARTQDADLHVAAAQSLNSGWVSLHAAHDVIIDGPIAIDGASYFGARTNANATTRGYFRVGFKSDGSFAGRVDIDRTGNGIIAVDGIDYEIINSLGAQGSMTGTDLQGINGTPYTNFALGADIDASATSTWSGGFLPIGGVGGSYIDEFRGNADGLGHVIQNATLGCGSFGCGLFGIVEGPSIYVAGDNLAHISNFGVVGGSVNGSPAGPLMGAGWEFDIVNCYATTNVAGGSGVGGLVGESYDININGSHASGNVNGTSAGGLLGNVLATTNIDRSYATGDVSGNGYVGGLVGHNESGSSDHIDESYATGNVTSTGDYAGGLIGSCNDYIHRSFATGNVSGTNYVGGFAGSGQTVFDSYSTGSVTATGNVVGGFTGWTTYMGNVYSTGLVTVAPSSTEVGGLLGRASGPPINGAYWDTQTSGMFTSLAGMGEPTAAMFEQATFVGFDFTNTWFIAEGEHDPILRWQVPTCAPGYAAADGINCTDVDECATANGGCAQTCTNTAGSYNCSCGSGYTLDANGHGCIAVTSGGVDAGTLIDGGGAISDAGGTSSPDASPSTPRDSGTTMPPTPDSGTTMPPTRDGGATGGKTGGTMNGGNGATMSGSHGGCSVAPGDSTSATSFFWVSALFMIALGVRSRRAKTERIADRLSRKSALLSN